MKIIGRLLDKLPGVDSLIDNPRAVLIAVCAGIIVSVVLVVAL